jgi:O-antigen ligase
MQREHRLFHACAMLLCVATLAQIMDRSALLGFSLAVGFLVVLGVGRSRVYSFTLAAALCALVLVSAQGELPIPGGTRLHNFYLIVSSGADFRNDPDGSFRLQRWRESAAVWMSSPVFGVGFGTPIMTGTIDERHGETKDANQRGGLGAFNAGMPHNSFLMAMARTGIIGLSFICFAWFNGILRIAKLAIKGIAGADEMVAAGALVAMISTATLNLFFERPMLCAPFWITLAASSRLSERVAPQFVKTLTAAAAPIGAARLPQLLRAPRLTPSQNEVSGGWQARWK